MVLASGCFDGIHAGHVRYLDAAKALCGDDELLIVAVAPDAYITSTKHRRPRWPQADRVDTLHALQSVDAAVAQTTESVASLIRSYRPRLFVKGPDWKTRIPEDVYIACGDVGTSIAFVETPGLHCSETITSDEEALQRFEEIALTQKPAVEPWQPVTDYSFDARKAIEGQHPQLIKEVFQPSEVLNIGCGTGYLDGQLRDGTIAVTGIDLHPPSGPHFFAQDICDPRPIMEWDLPFVGHDLVICREVLEHLTIRQIRQAVRNMCCLSDRFVYVTTRFAQHPDHLLTVDTQDGLDPTHISMVNQTFLRALFVLEGFKRRADLEQKMDWKQAGRALVYERT